MYCGQRKNVVKTVVGTCLIANISCQCKTPSRYYSQPMSGTMPIGNIVLAGGIMFFGASLTTTWNVFRHAGIQMFQWQNILISSVSTVTNAQVLNEALIFRPKNHVEDHTSSSAFEAVPETENVRQYPLSSPDQSDKPIFLTTESSIIIFPVGIQHHIRLCHKCLNVNSIE